MKLDVLQYAQGVSGKRVSKETLNHPEFISRVCGFDVFEDTPRAYRMAYEALGIDIINRVPMKNAPSPTPKGVKQPHPSKPYSFTQLGVYDTAFREVFEVSTPEEVFGFDASKLDYEELIVPVPHPCRKDDIYRRQEVLGNVGMYYPMLYTTLFMWAVETLGWENFMVAAMSQPERFCEVFVKPCAMQSRKIVETIAAASESPFVFLHDDLADARGPVFPLNWYEDCIFPYYPAIFEPAKSRGKKIIFVADGNMAFFLARLAELGVDGVMCENPATPFEACLDVFGRQGRYFIGGIETAVLAFSDPSAIRKMVHSAAEKASGCPGFALSSCGGLHGDIPIDNLEAYFDARADIGATPKNWRYYFK